MISTSTMYWKRVQTIESQTAATNVLMLDDNRVRLHWVDNYARFIKANCLWYRQDILRQLLWTAHGFKSLPIPVSMTWKLDSKNQPVVAMPPLEGLLSSKAIASLHGDLSQISPCQFEDSYAVRKNITRVPLKSPLPEDESLVDGHSADGLHSFYPVDLYQDNIVSTKGLVAVFSRLQKLEGFGIEHHRRSAMYSVIHVDVSIWWHLFRMLYSYEGMSGIHRDLFLCYGFWHPYYYINIAIGNEFRVPFLGGLFFTLFPQEKKMMRRGELQHNATLFSWMRFAYPEFSLTLKEKLQHFRITMIEEIQAKKRAAWVENPYRARCVSLITCDLRLAFINYCVLLCADIFTY